MSFILRQVHSNGSVQNHCLGNRYVLHHIENNPEEFEKALGVTVTHPDQENIFAILFYSGGDNEQNYPLYNSQSYYIMTESGATFERIHTPKSKK